MIVLTVKTLDSQNHSFTVDDDITVEEFKTKIADTVNIPAETQRIIYCGRVLQDDAKLSDYDVNGKVVHLVQRAPPSANPPTTRSASPQPTRRSGFRGFEPGNTMYLGSMAFPSNLMESQGIVPPPPTHSLAGSRLNVARRMLRRADAVITLLENPSARPNEVPNAEEQQEEEVTPIIEARVIVPPGNNDHIDEAMVISAVQNSLFDTGAIPLGTQESSTTNSTPPPEYSTTSSPEENATASTSTTEGTPSSSSSTSNNRGIAENASRTSEMAELLLMLNQLQARFTPFLERYRHFMIEDPVIPPENARQTQAMLSRVSEVLHFLGHAYHSLSDIIIRVRTPPPRPLLCRPILIQHSAVVQTGIPIQVEAQFNLSTERPNTTTASSNSTSSAPPTTTSSSTSSIPGSAAAASQPTTAPTTTTTTGSEGGVPAPSATPPTVNFRGFPFIPTASMRVQSFPIELRTAARPVNLTQRSNNNNNNTVGGSEANNASTSSTNPTSTSSTSENNTTFQLPNFDNSSVEFFMEVTPEVLQGTLNGPPPEFLQSLVQMAGQIMNRVTTTNASANGSTPTTNSNATDSSQPNVPSQSTAGQNSQARGNTQTNPTTATHTRSTSRPHVHLAQQAMQGGFDPFLPCNSHHITHRRRNQHQHEQRQQQQQSQTTQQQQQQQQQQHNTLRETLQAFRNNLITEATRREDVNQPSNVSNSNSNTDSRLRDDTQQQAANVMADFYTSMRNAFQRIQTENRRPNEGVQSTTSSTSFTGGIGDSNASSANNEQIPRPQFPPFANVIPNLQGTLANLSNLLQGPTIADILQQLPLDDATIRPGESMITDLIMLLSRNLTIVDMISLNTGNFEPLNRVTDEMQTFFRTRVLDNSTSPEAVDRGVDRFINEMQPFFQNFNRLRVRDDIDIVRSVEHLFRLRLPDIIRIAANSNPQNMRELVNKCLTLAKLMCALALHASVNGIQGVEETFQQIITSYMQGIPAELQNWTVMTSCANLRHFMNNLDPSDVQQYIIRTTDVPMATDNGRVQSETTTPPPEEPMELDEASPPSEQVSTTSLQPPEDTEPLPNVIIGSESWHGQVPEDWVPIITRDVQRQRRQNTQTPFSDAYLSGMPTKRRKIVNNAKPQGSLPQVISDSVRRAVTATGLASVAPLEVVSQGAGDCLDVQTAYRNLLRTTVQAALRDNEDFTPERFPNASTYFKTP